MSIKNNNAGSEGKEKVLEEAAKNYRINNFGNDSILQVWDKEIDAVFIEGAQWQSTLSDRDKPQQAGIVQRAKNWSTKIANECKYSLEYTPLQAKRLYRQGLEEGYLYGSGFLQQAEASEEETVYNILKRFGLLQSDSFARFFQDKIEDAMQAYSAQQTATLNKRIENADKEIKALIKQNTDLITGASIPPGSNYSQIVYDNEYLTLKISDLESQLEQKTAMLNESETALEPYQNENILLKAQLEAGQGEKWEDLNDIHTNLAKSNISPEHYQPISIAIIKLKNKIKPGFLGDDLPPATKESE